MPNLSGQFHLYRVCQAQSYEEYVTNDLDLIQYFNSNSLSFKERRETKSTVTKKELLKFLAIKKKNFISNSIDVFAVFIYVSSTYRKQHDHIIRAQILYQSKINLFFLLKLFFCSGYLIFNSYLKIKCSIEVIFKKKSSLLEIV